ncbi:hypothetical protein NUU61_003516 [Penicillium alfredii]|uniref:Uncharacterized protein n=1 Tax=Penicillium alfredii TaxID=1506179 RepID=A0A9W9KCJ0_9EURO|nr:uncharacterized protein NUU61_003516 [Penicillium alfredii]KAJ5101294.1 hypothetical protein NUU61_003516 [Penicillium alfredii]
MPQSLVLGTPFFPLESVRLGRLVLNIKEPQQDYFDPPCQRSEDASVQEHEGYGGVDNTGSNRDFVSLLTRLVAASHIKRMRTSTQVSTPRARTYQLRNSGVWFRRALEAEATRDWVEEAVDQGDEVYLIVGYHTFQDARFMEHAVEMSESFAQLNLPINAAMPGIGGSGAGLGASIVGGDISDPAISGCQQSARSLQKHFVATGEQVVAIQYRRLRFRWYSSRNLDRAALEKNRWHTRWNMRGEQDNAVDDVLEADLEDGPALKDLPYQERVDVHAVEDWEVYL